MILTTPVALVALVLLLTLRYGIFAWADHVLKEYLGGNIVTHTLSLSFFWKLVSAVDCRD
jgi:hypothetical protein